MRRWAVLLPNEPWTSLLGSHTYTAGAESVLISLQGIGRTFSPITRKSVTVGVGAAPCRGVTVGTSPKHCSLTVPSVPSWLYKEATVQQVDVLPEAGAALVKVTISNAAYGKFQKLFPE